MADVGYSGKLVGRRMELGALDDLLRSVRANESRVLVIHGDAGVGKSALLGYLAATASGCIILRSTGVESEMELPYAGLHQFCAPLLSRLDSVPQPQREALTTAFGLSTGEAANPFLVGLAVLSLLSEAANEQPVVCLIDDAQWLDRQSAHLLAFVARRLLADPVAIVFALRDPSVAPELTNLPRLTVEGLGVVDATALLDTAFVGKVDARVRDRIVAETGGNPLALLELPRGLSVVASAGGFAFPDATPLAGHIEHSFLQRARRLPVGTQSLLLVAAAEPIGDTALLWRAATALGIGPDAAGPAESEGLLELGLQVRFCHPLVRSAIYRAADGAQRRDVHRALAECTDAVKDPDRRAWHMAQAVNAPDEGVAAELERSAERARRRGGSAAATAFLTRAAELTPSPGRRASRALAAAATAYEAGAPDTAHALLTSAEVGPLDDLQHARLQRLNAQLAFAGRRGTDAPALLLDAAARLAPLDGELARETYLEAFAAALFAGRFQGTRGMRAVAEAARHAPAASQSPRPIDLLLDGLVERFSQGHAAALPTMRLALAGFERVAERGGDAATAWLWLAWFVAGDSWESHWWFGLAEAATRLSRDAGALTFLPVCLEGTAAAHVHAGEFQTAAAYIDESDSISRATGNAPLRYTSLVLAAWRGDESVATPLIESRVADAFAAGEGRVIGLAGYTKAVLYNGLGRYQAALEAARAGSEHDDLELSGFTLVELVEAAARAGAHDEAREAFQRLEGRTQPAATEWGLGVEARSRALVSTGAAAETLYLEAIERLARSGIAIHHARAHLVYGEWLRRENRRVDAREHLRTAHEMLADFGAKAFAERARRELVATGETVRARSVAGRDTLTSQELQIARLAADRLSNPEIAAQLYLSPRTVEYHLHKVFSKLGIASRKDLETALKSAR